MMAKINGKQIKMNGTAGHFASLAPGGGLEDSGKGAAAFAPEMGALEDQDASDTLPGLTSASVWTRLQTIRNNLKSLFAKTSALFHGMTLLPGVWFVKATTDFVPPAPASAAQNYFDTTTNKKYTALPDLSGWEEAADQPLPAALSAGNGYYMEVTGQFWDIADAGYAGHMTGIVNTDGAAVVWTYAPDKQRAPDGATVRFNSSSQIEAIEVNHTTGAITEDTAKFTTGANSAIIQKIISKINGIFTLTGSMGELVDALSGAIKVFHDSVAATADSKTDVLVTRYMYQSDLSTQGAFMEAQFDGVGLRYTAISGTSLRLSMRSLSDTTVPVQYNKSSLIEEKVKQNLKIRILTMHPDSIYLKEREKNEKEVEGQIRNTIVQLVEWVTNLKKMSPDPKNIQIKFYDALPLDSYLREDDHLFIGPYLYGKESQQTISFEFRKAQGFAYYTDYFDKLWNDDTFLPKKDFELPNVISV
jgi:hypothetical protein